MVRRRLAQLRKITPREFAKRLRFAANDHDKRFAFFLGAGCSISSGIPAAGRLVRDKETPTDWLRTYRDMNAPEVLDEQLDDWARRTLPNWDPEAPGSAYGTLIERLFLHNGDRQREIERICDGEGVFPGFGYAVLSGLMLWPRTARPNSLVTSSVETGQFNIALTTNFDDLLVDSFFYFRQVRPLVIHHDSLAPFVRPTRVRPMIVKLHGDHQLAPRNRDIETSELGQTLRDRVSVVLHDRSLIFVGYGGGDESIVSMLEQLPEESLPFGVYWVSAEEPRGIFRAWLESREAIWVKHQDFDELMLLLMKEFDLDNPNRSVWDRVHDRYNVKRKELERAIREKDDPEFRMAIRWISAWEKVENEDLDEAEAEFEALLVEHPRDARILGGFSVFLSDKLQDHERAEGMFKRAIEADPNHANNLGNYALFLKNDVKDLERAEGMFKRAIEADSKNARNLGNYALFLADDRKELERAEGMFQQAIEADPKHANNLGDYALFLKNDVKDLERAEGMFQRAIEADPSHTNNLGNYALFLKNDVKDLERAEGMFQRAIEADPNHANNLGNYALFLKNDVKDLERAEGMFERAIEADSKNARNLGNYAHFLADDRKDLVRAEGMFQRAVEADPNHAHNLGRFALFLSDDLQDLKRAEGMFQRAIEADPQHANNLGNYARFLSVDVMDLERAEGMFQRAIEADPQHMNNLGSYALFLSDAKKDLDGAEVMYQRAVQADSGHPIIMSNAGYFFAVDRENPEEAVRVLRLCIQRNPKDLRAICYLAYVLGTHSDETAEAEALYNRAIELDPFNAIAVGNYGGFQLSLGNQTAGLERVYKALGLHKDQLVESRLACEFFAFAHGSRGDRFQRLFNIATLLRAGVTTGGWNFKRNIERAIADGFSPKTWLRKLGLVVCGRENGSILSAWNAWQEVNRQLDEGKVDQ